MSINTRAQEIVNGMNTFGKPTYHRSEVLPELFALQQEIISLTFKEGSADQGALRIWDVERHLEQMNADLGGIATEQLQRFESGCKDLCNMIKAEISGSKGESKAFRSLDRLRCPNRVLHNVELTVDEERSELDAVVITRKGLFIIEVKNTSRDIFIDENGNYFRTGEYLKWDSNIAGKMDVKIHLLRSVLKNTGMFDVPITGIVVFTDNRIQVRNCYANLNTCFLSQLPYIIQDFKGPNFFNEEQLESTTQRIEEARCMETYPMKLDVAQFKEDFAILMALLEAASSQMNPEAIKLERVESRTEAPVEIKQVTSIWTFINAFKSIFKSRYFRTAASVATTFAVTIVTTAFTTRHTI